ncbi:YolD-like family protein [Bacillus thuringiensis]|nr:YolD-like family protein [Bacillus thuringiensis]
MSINDRGLKKWQGFFMPEHVEGIKQMWLDDQKIKMPIWDEEQIAEFEQLIRYAKDYNLYVDLSIYNEGFERKITCSVKALNPLEKVIKVVTADGMENIQFDKILNVTVID